MTQTSVGNPAVMQQEIVALKAALEASEYLAQTYERLWKGGVSRDLAEAIGAYNAARAQVDALGGGLNEHKEVA